jgi:hypothetical protein
MTDLPTYNGLDLQNNQFVHTFSDGTTEVATPVSLRVHLKNPRYTNNLARIILDREELTYYALVSTEIRDILMQFKKDHFYHIIGEYYGTPR